MGAPLPAQKIKEKIAVYTLLDSPHCACLNHKSLRCKLWPLQSAPLPFLTSVNCVFFTSFLCLCLPFFLSAVLFVLYNFISFISAPFPSDVCLHSKPLHCGCSALSLLSDGFHLSLCACCPASRSLIATDFDRLPDVRIPGRNAPLVAEKVC